jgi:hypothetical protein
MPNEMSHESRVVEEQVRSLGSLPHAPAPPDPDLLWMRAQILAREEAALTALRNATLARTLRYGLVAAGGAWLLAEGAGIDTWLQAMVSTASVTAAILAAFGAAALLSGLVLGRSFVAERLRDLGLL